MNRGGRATTPNITVHPIPTIIVGEGIRPGRYTEWMNHYTLLRTIENAYELRPLGRAHGVAAVDHLEGLAAHKAQPYKCFKIACSNKHWPVGRRSVPPRQSASKARGGAADVVLLRLRTGISGRSLN
jgi:hypothetical protein